MPIGPSSWIKGEVELPYVLQQYDMGPLKNAQWHHQ
jgi:hypothetical protein